MTHTTLYPENYGGYPEGRTDYDDQILKNNSMWLFVDGPTQPDGTRATYYADLSRPSWQQPWYQDQFGLPRVDSGLIPPNERPIIKTRLNNIAHVNLMGLGIPPLTIPKDTINNLYQ